MILDQNYKDLQAVSNSSGKFFRKEGPKLYFDEFLDPLRIEQREKSTESTDIGDLVDCILTQPKEVFDKFYYISGGVKGSADLKAVMDGTWQLVMAELTQAPVGALKYEEALLHPKLKDASLVRDELVRTARSITTAKGEIGYRNNYKDEVKLADLLVNEGGAYYNDLGTANGRKILDQTTYNTAVACKDSILNNEFTGPLFELPEDPDMELNTQLMIVEAINGVLCKILLDYCLFNHKSKVIWPKDVKSAFSHRQFRENYNKWDYPNQGSFYTGILQAAFPDYKIMPFEFIVGCTQSGEEPMIYQMSKSELEIARKGAVLKSGRIVPGWESTLAEIKWHTDMGNWQYPRNYYESGRLILNTYSDEAVDEHGIETEEDIF